VQAPMRSQPGRLTHQDRRRRRAIDGLGFVMTFEGYLREAVRSGALVSVLDDWCASFPGPFLYYPSRRQLPPALSAFVAFVAEWRRQEKRSGKGA
jgi:DNA-binding transcriptional LysR family regulator